MALTEQRKRELDEIIRRKKLEQELNLSSMEPERRTQIQQELAQPTQTGLTPQRKAELDQIIAQKKQEQEPGLVQSLAQSIATPFKTVASTALGVAESIPPTIQGTVARYVAKDKEKEAEYATKAQQALSKERDFGYLGKGTPLFYDEKGELRSQQTNPILQSLEEWKSVAGAGLEIGSYAGGGPIVKGVSKPLGVLGKTKQFAKLGALEGGMFGAGAELQRPESTARSVIGEAALGSALGAGTGAALPVAGAALSKTGRAIKGGAQKAGEAAGPIVRGAQKQVPKSLEYGVSQATGLNPMSVKAFVNNPGRYTTEFLGSLDRQSLQNEVMKALQKKADELAGLGSEYASIQKQKIPFIFNKNKDGVHEILANRLREFGLDFQNGKLVKTADTVPMERGDLREIQEFVDIFGRRNVNSGRQYLNLRRTLDKMAYPGGDKIGVSGEFGRLMRRDYDELVKDTYQGLRQLDDEFAPLKTDLDAVIKDFGDPNAPKDYAASRLANLLGENNFQRLERIKKVIPDIEQKVQDLVIAEDLARTGGQKVGTYTKAILTGGAVFSGNIPVAIASWLLTTPDNIVLVLTSFGKMKNRPGVKKIIDKILGNKELTAFERKTVNEAVKETYAEFKKRVLKESLTGENQPKLLQAGNKSTIIAPATKDPSRAWTQEEILQAYPQFLKRQIQVKNLTPEAKNIPVRTPQTAIKELADVEKKIEKKVEKFRKEAGMMAEREGAGVTHKTVLDGRGNPHYTVGQFSKKLRNKSMKTQATNYKKEAEKLLLENDPEFQQLIKKRDELKKLASSAADIASKTIPFGLAG
jgi:hypothetical protein